MEMSLTQLANEAGFKIRCDVKCDRIGPYNVVTIIREGKRTRRTARKYDEALEACAKARGLL